jgi:acyl-CoA dehydrogenase
MAVAAITDLTTEANERQQWMTIARRLSAQFAQRAALHDNDDSFVAENYTDMRAARLFSAAVPSELGGGGASYETICDVIRTIGRGCGSTALAYSMHAHLLAATIWRYRHNAQPPAEPLLRRIAAEELVLVSTGGSDWLDGSGTLEKVDGGYQLTAHKIFGSGSPSGDLLLTTGVYDDPSDGPVVLHFGVSLKAEGVQILENWRTMGMRGSGSNDIAIENVFVPEAGVSVRRPRGTWAPFFNVISPIVWPLVLSAYLGVAEEARDIAVTQASKRAKDSTIQALVGEMDTELNAARILLDDLIRIGSSTFTPSLETSNSVYMSKTVIARSLLRTVEKAMEVVGGAGFFRGLGLERRFRDIQGVRYHPWQEKKQELFSGRASLGLPVDA